MEHGAFRAAALCVSCASLHLVSGGLYNRQAGPRGRRPHETGLRFPLRQRQTQPQDLCYPELLTGGDKSPQVRVPVSSGEAGFLQGNWEIVKPLFSNQASLNTNKYFILYQLLDDICWLIRFITHFLSGLFNSIFCRLMRFSTGLQYIYCSINHCWVGLI